MDFNDSRVLANVLSKVSNVFHSIHVVDISQDTCAIIKTNPFVSRYVHDGEGARQMMHDVMSAASSKEDLKKILEFSNLDTLPDRIKGQDFLQTIFKGQNVGYVRARFVPCEVDAAGAVTSVVFMIEVIDDLMRQQEIAQRNSLTDALTGLRNRRAYEEAVKHYEETALEPDFVFVSADANGLKVINDTKGHLAGDECINGVTACLKRCFGPYGQVYRIGGDEFVALLLVGKNQLKPLLVDFQNCVDMWHGQLVDQISVSFGVAVHADNEQLSFQELASVAEKRMYEAKSNYYKNKGVDRRGQNLAYMALVKSYTKILEASLTTDTFRVIQMDEIERDAPHGFEEKLSAWLRHFAMAGMVHPDDRDIYLKETSFDHLRQHFRKGSTAFALRYRRLIEGEYRHAMLEIVPTKSYTHEDQSVYVLVKKIDA